ncbi:MAG: mannose-6-phosphate isomerase, class I [Rhodoglobus sp.]
MFVAITNTPRDYAWGSTGAISALLGRTPTDALEAELWLGSHHGSPASIVDLTQSDGHSTLAGFIDLPFLMKVLASAEPLSLQAHPNLEQARIGFERENAAGIALDAPNRNYRDASAKPEFIVALNDGFEALCGFRHHAAAKEIFTTIAHRGEGPAFQPLLARLSGPDPVRSTFEWFAAHEHGELAVLDNLCIVATEAEGTDHDRDEYDVVRRLAARYPGDPGIAISLLLNHVRLSAGEALFLPAGNIHAYLSGIGIEVMASSDNVLRGGLTPKHVDVPELMAVLDFSSRSIPYLQPDTGPGVSIYRPAGEHLALARITADGATVDPQGDAVALCVGGAVTIHGVVSSFSLARGEAALVMADEGRLRFSGKGDVYLAASGLSG